MNCYRLVSFLCITVLLSACSGIRVMQDYDTQTNFSKLRSFAWQDTQQKPTGDARIDNSLLDDRVRSAIERNLIAKGYKKAAGKQSDFMLAYHYAIREKIDTDRVSFGIGIGAGRGSHFGSVGYGMGVHDHYDDFDQYELIVDIVNPANQKIMWRGSVTRRLLYSSDPVKTTTRINEVVNAIIAKFPPLQ